MDVGFLQVLLTIACFSCSCFLRNGDKRKEVGITIQEYNVRLAPIKLIKNKISKILQGGG